MKNLFNLSGRFEWQVLNADGSIADSGEHKNLILDSGLDAVASNYFADIFRYCAVGTGNTAPAVAQQGLVNEVARTGNLLTGAGACGTTNTALNIYEMRRTFDFPIGAINTSVTEIAVSWASGAGANAFSRSLFQQAGAPVAVPVAANQSLRVVYILTVTIGSLSGVPDVPRINGKTTVVASGAVTASQSGNTVTASAAFFAAGDVGKKIAWNIGGYEAVITAFTSSTIVTVDRSQNIGAGTFEILSGTGGIGSHWLFPTDYSGPVGGVRPDGSSAFGYLMPSQSHTGFIASQNTPTGIPTSDYGSALRSGADGKTAVAQNYVAGTFYRDFVMSAATNEFNQDIKEFGVCAVVNSGTAYYVLWEFVFTTAIQKQNTATISLGYRISWGRN